ncbi:hypothetical protein ACR6C2_14325 [Streptomyces sp. INA 01156]
MPTEANTEKAAEAAMPPKPNKAARTSRTDKSGEADKAALMDAGATGASPPHP